MSEGPNEPRADERQRDDAARIRRLEERIQVLSETMRAFAEATSDLDQLLDTVARRVARVIGDFCVLHVLSDDGERLVPVSAHARDAERLEQVKAMYAAAPVRIDEHEAVRRILQTGEALLAPRVDLAVHGGLTSPGYAEHFKVLGTHSLLAVAVRAAGRPIGLLSLRRYAPDAPSFDEADRDLAQTLADHAGLAITNAQLLRSAQQNVSARARAETRFARLADAGIIGIIVAQMSGKILEINDTLLAMIGYTREEILSGKVVWSELTPPEWKAVDTRAFEQLTTLGVSRLREKEYLRKDGGRTAVLAGTALLEGTDGEAISFVLDLTERKLAERDRAQLAAIIESSNDAIVAESSEGIIESWNAGAERLFGYSAEQAIGQPSYVVIPAERRAEKLALLERIAQGLAVPPFETTRIRKDGTIVDVSMAVSPIRGAHGAIVGVAAIVRDISASKRSERLIRESLAEKVVMLKEIHHRVKNNLQVVSSILRLHEKNITDPAARAAFEASQGRVRSIALLHEKLYQSRDLGSVGMAAYATSLATALIRTQGEASGRIKVEVEDSGVYLPVNLAAPCGLILNEFLTNAFNHAFVRRPGPAVVRVTVRKRDDMVELIVADNGVGLPPGFDITRLRSLGMFLTRTLAEQLRGTIELVTDHGTRCTLRFSERLEED
ncbi:MAG: signal transduction histidine kinase [Myxococcaceae bacterium]|nr:signal transduction histidine kinase [Myxococcaceae bacterium]